MNHLWTSKDIFDICLLRDNHLFFRYIISLVIVFNYIMRNNKTEILDNFFKHLLFINLKSISSGIFEI